MTESFTPREFIDKINAENPGSAFDPYGVEGLVTKQHEDSAGADLLAQAKAEVAKEKAKNTPEAQIAELERQVEAMRQWLIQDGTYSREEANKIAQRLNVLYNEETQQAEVLGYFGLYKLQSAKGLILPSNIYGDLNLESLTSAEGLVLPQSIGGELNLSSLTSTEGLQLPDSIGDLDLSGLTSAEGLVFPQSIGDLELRSLTTAEGLELPQSIDDLYLDSLTSAEGLQLPDSIGSLGLSSLTSAEGLTLPTSVGGHLDLSGLTTAEREHLRVQRPDLAGKIYPKN
jgi:hypothetical protein